MTKRARLVVPDHHEDDAVVKNEGVEKGRLIVEGQILPIKRASHRKSSSSSSSSSSHDHADASSDREQPHGGSDVDDDDEADTVRSLSPSVYRVDKQRSANVRKRQHQKSDKQRRAKIKEGMDQLKALVAAHGKLESPDQAAIVLASVDLLHSLMAEVARLKQQLEQATGEAQHTPPSPTPSEVDQQHAEQQRLQQLQQLAQQQQQQMNIENPLHLLTSNAAYPHASVSNGGLMQHPLPYQNLMSLPHGISEPDLLRGLSGMIMPPQQRATSISSPTTSAYNPSALMHGNSLAQQLQQLNNLSMFGSSPSHFLIGGSAGLPASSSAASSSQPASSSSSSASSPSSISSQSLLAHLSSLGLPTNHGVHPPSSSVTASPLPLMSPPPRLELANSRAFSGQQFNPSYLGSTSPSSQTAGLHALNGLSMDSKEWISIPHLNQGGTSSNQILPPGPTS